MKIYDQMERNTGGKALTGSNQKRMVSYLWLMVYSD